MSGSEPNWVPLERLAPRAARSGVHGAPDDFINAGGFAYRCVNERYELYRSALDAIAHVEQLMVSYECWTYVDARFTRPYEPGDRLVKGWSDGLEVDSLPTGRVSRCCSSGCTCTQP